MRSAPAQGASSFDWEVPSASAPAGRAAHEALLASDVELMAQAAAGHLSAQRLVVERLMARSQKLTRSWLGNSADASDASQISILEILRSAGTYRGESTLERWADRIIIRTLLRAVADRRGRAQELEPASEPTVAGAADPTVIVHEYLSRLSEVARTVLILRHGFEHSIDEIAELTGVSPNTAKDRLLRAREAVRALLERDNLRSEQLPGRAGQVERGAARRPPAGQRKRVTRR